MVDQIIPLRGACKARRRGGSCVSSWITLDQRDASTQFAHCTGDHQWIHVDPERAARESPFGGAIAHGFLTLSR